MRLGNNGVYAPPTRAFDIDVLAWESAVIGNGGTVSLDRRVIVDQFVFSEKASGAWALTDDYWALWGENAAQSLTSLKQRRLAVAVNSPALTANRDYSFDGLTNYIDTGFVPGSHAVALGTDNARIAVYERTDVSGNTSAIGTNSGSGRQLRIQPRFDRSGLGCSNTYVGTFTLPVADSRGYFAAARGGASPADANAYKNGVMLTRTIRPADVAALLPIHSVHIGAFNNAGFASNPRASDIGLACIGASLSGSQELAQYTAVQAFATAVGAQV